MKTGLEIKSKKLIWH